MAQHLLPVPPLELVPQEVALFTCVVTITAPPGVQEASMRLTDVNNESLLFTLIKKRLLFPLVFLFRLGHRSWSPRSGKRGTPLLLIY